MIGQAFATNTFPGARFVGAVASFLIEAELAFHGRAPYNAYAACLETKTFLAGTESFQLPVQRGKMVGVIGRLSTGSSRT